MFFEHKDTSIYNPSAPLYILMSRHKRDIYIPTCQSHTHPSSNTASTSQLWTMDDWFFVIMSVFIVDDSYKGRQKQVHSWYRKEFLKSLDIIQRRQHKRKIPRCCLQDPSDSAWHKLYKAQNDQGMIMLTGFDCASFSSLCSMFAPVFDLYTPFVPSGTSCFEWEKQPKKGRPRIFTQKTVLDLF